MGFQTESLVEVTRGGRVESEHRGAIAVVDAAGKLIAHVGDVDLISFLRSSAKPFQALPLIESGAADRFGFTDQELAIIAGSHSGEARHLEVVQSILNKIGLKEDALQCGVHVPFSPESAQRLRESGQAPTPIYNNCSGKHAGMLAQAIARGLSTHEYLDPNHPVQVSIRRTLADLAGIAFDEVGVGTDGCSAPNFALPLRAAALAFAKLAKANTTSAQNSQDTLFAEQIAKSLKGLMVTTSISVSRDDAMARIARAMITYPGMVAGEDRLDTDLMRAARQQVVSKGGAEGFHGLGIFPADGRPALGIAIKIGDGDGKRGGHPVVIETLKQLGILDDEALSALKTYHAWPVTNHQGRAVGEVRANFKLIRDT